MLTDDELDGFWSLRKADGLSYLLVELNDLCASDMRSARIENALGPKNSRPSGWSIRQLRHLVAAFRVAGSVMQAPERIALTDADGMTWRPDKAPQALRDAIEARELVEQAEATERACTRCATGWLVRNDPAVHAAFESMRRNIFGYGPIFAQPIFEFQNHSVVKGSACRAQAAACGA